MNHCLKYSDIYSCLYKGGSIMKKMFFTPVVYLIIGVLMFVAFGIS